MSYLLEPRKQFTVRIATMQDIPAIRNCNLETLPENYSDEFYRRHLFTWPRLAIVAEKDNKLIGYTLGRVDTQSALRIASSSSSVPDIGTYTPPVTVGHVASIAVYPPYRKLGVARSLMDMLHTEIANHESPVDTVSLHCRVSNAQAIRLYSGHFPYQCVSVVPEYYADREDAWLMRLSGLQGYLQSKASDARSLSMSGERGDDATLAQK